MLYRFLLKEAVERGSTVFFFMVLLKTFYNPMKVKLPMYLPLPDGPVRTS